MTRLLTCGDLLAVLDPAARPTALGRAAPGGNAGRSSRMKAPAATGTDGRL
ncbi:hypothetical protein [Streptomyces sp. NPDC056061]|uniref:hypothetical protein n=1 Tax=Streptomyces sp. NPDC056061 TaxID=3345700 RepID=UPI0035DD6A40